MGGGLGAERCEPCRGGVPALTAAESRRLASLVPGWSILEAEGVPKLEREYRFKDFAQALAFTDRVGALAERHGHHPDILTSWGRVRVSFWTHKIGGLHRNDFIMAAKTDSAFTEMTGPSQTGG